MQKPNPQTHSPTTSTSDTEILTCLLRLRYSPPVPYSIIASLLLQSRPSLTGRLSEGVAVRCSGEDDGRGKEAELRMWLEAYLRDVYDRAEKWESEAWKLARGWWGENVKEVVRGLGLGLRLGVGGGWVSGSGRGSIGVEGGEDGFVVLEDEELELQIEWRKEGD